MTRDIGQAVLGEFNTRLTTLVRLSIFRTVLSSLWRHVPTDNFWLSALPCGYTNTSDYKIPLCYLISQKRVLIIFLIYIVAKYDSHSI